MTEPDAPTSAAPRLTLLALHGLRLKGFADAATVASYVGVPEDLITPHLELLAAEGLVARRRGDDGCWVLTALGRREGERLLGAELDAAGQRDVVEAAYQDFRRLNPEFLAACSAWQVKDPASGVLNDHTDPDYDRRIIERLSTVHDAVQPVVDRLGRALTRFADYGPRLAAALARVEAGDHRWLTKPLIASYHTLWFELHEDLLATLGLDRRAEATAPA